MLDYLIPGATEVPDIRVLHMETPSPHTEFGIKGIGEGGAVGPPAAIVCAVNDALRAVGAEVHDLPLTPERILDTIAAGAARREPRRRSSRPIPRSRAQTASPRPQQSSARRPAAREPSQAVSRSARC